MHAGRQCDLGWLSGCAEAVTEGTDDGVMPRGDECGHVERGSDGRTATVGDAWSAAGAAVAVEWSDTDEFGNGLLADRAEFGEFGNESGGDDGTDTWDGAEEIFLVAPDGA